eukprot:2578589-Pyramimonas_sp.AAC.1
MGGDVEVLNVATDGVKDASADALSGRVGEFQYINKMFDLKLLSCYKYFFKIDYDIFFLRPLGQKLVQQMEERQAVFLHSGTA